MAGFKGKRKPSKNFESELDAVMEEEESFEDNYDSYGYDDYDDDDVVMEYRPKEEKKKTQETAEKKTKQTNKEKGLSSKNSKMIGIGLVVGLAVVLILVGVTVFGGEKEEEEKPGINGQTSKKQEEMVSGEDSELPSADGSTSSNPMLSGSSSNTNNSSGTETSSGVTMEDSSNTINPGLPDPEKGKQNVNNGTIEDASGFLVDINGNKIPENYTTEKIVTETDFISYVKKRGITADGIELLWLDAEYKGQPYTVQVPFKIWKELDSQGITVVEMEVLYLQDDAKVISYMKVKENYKEIMEKGEAALKK